MYVTFNLHFTKLGVFDLTAISLQVLNSTGWPLYSVYNMQHTNKHNKYTHNEHSSYVKWQKWPSVCFLSCQTGYPYRPSLMSEVLSQTGQPRLY